MTQEEMRRLEQEVLEVGQEARATQHPLVMAGVLMGLYAHSALAIDRMALAYVLSLLLESVTLPGVQE